MGGWGCPEVRSYVSSGHLDALRGMGWVKGRAWVGGNTVYLAPRLVGNHPRNFWQREALRGWSLCDDGMSGLNCHLAFCQSDAADGRAQVLSRLMSSSFTRAHPTRSRLRPPVLESPSAQTLGRPSQAMSGTLLSWLRPCPLAQAPSSRG